MFFLECMGKCFRNIKREMSLFLVSFGYFIHVAIGARPLTTFYWRMSDIILICEWTVVITCRVLNHCPPFDLMDKTSWIIIDRSTLIQYHVYFFLSNGLGGGAVFRRPMHPTMKSTRVGPIIFYYIFDRVVLVHRSGVITSTCFKNRLHLNI